MASGDVNKIINGSLFDAEFDPIAVAVATKVDKVAGETGEVPVFTASGGLESSGTVMFPSGTSMAFFQPSAPSGWTQDISNTNAMLRVVDSSGGGTGGTDSPISLDTTHTHTTGNHAITESEMPVHYHETSFSNYPRKVAKFERGSSHGLNDREDYVSTSGQSSTDDAGSGDAHNHGATGSGGSVWTPKYLDMIICTRD